jgi:hypothetical protein
MLGAAFVGAQLYNKKYHCPLKPHSQSFTKRTPYSARTHQQTHENGATLSPWKAHLSECVRAANDPRQGETATKRKRTFSAGSNSDHGEGRHGPAFEEAKSKKAPCCKAGEVCVLEAGRSSFERGVKVSFVL